MHSYHPSFVATRAHQSEAIAINDASTMEYQDHLGREYMCTDLQLNDCSEDFDVSHWPQHPLGPQRPLDLYYHFSNGPQLMGDQGWVRDLDISPPAYHLFSSSRYPSYHSPNEELQHPYYSSPSTRYNSSSASSDRLSPSIGSRASSLLPSPETCYIEVPGLEFTPNSDGFYEDSPCVAMQNVQKSADAMNEDSVDDYTGYEYEPQELVPAASEYHEPTPSAYGQLPIPVAQQGERDESPSEPSPEPRVEHRRLLVKTEPDIYVVRTQRHAARLGCLLDAPPRPGFLLNARTALFRTQLRLFAFSQGMKAPYQVAA
jgi:hypothetical protein